MIEFRFTFHWSMFPGVQLTISQYWFSKRLCVEQATSHYLNQCWPDSLTHICGTRGRWVNWLVSQPHVSQDPKQKITVSYQWFYQYDDVIKWKHLPRYWPVVRGIHRSPVNSTHKGQWRGTLMVSLIYAWINDWVNNREAGDLRPHYDVTVMENQCDPLF